MDVDFPKFIQDLVEEGLRPRASMSSPICECWYVKTLTGGRRPGRTRPGYPRWRPKCGSGP
jgi:hypothetical protein